MDAVVELGLLNALLAALLALAAAVVTWGWRRPALAHALWLLVLLKLVTPPVLPVDLPWSQPALEEAGGVPVAALPAEGGPELVTEPAAVVPEPSGPGVMPAEQPARPWSWQAAVGAVWLAGSCLWWSLAAWRLGRFRRLLRCARPAPAAVQDRARELAGRLGLGRCPGVWLVPAPVPPLLWSLLGPPRVVLPAALWADLTGEQQDTLLAHELAHLRRRDHLVRRLELLALGLYWWHAVAWWARGRLHEAEELLCDARVVRALPGAADVYAEALVRTVAFLSGPRPALPSAASGMGQVRVLKGRLVMIMRGTTSDRLPRAGAWILLALGAAVLVLRPGWAPADDPAAPGQDTPASAPAADDPPAVVQGGVAVPASPRGDGVRRTTAGADVPAREEKASPAAKPGTTTGSRAEDFEVELLKAQLQAKEAELEEAQVLLKQAKSRQVRLEQMHQQRVVAQEELDKARNETAVLVARLRGKEAQVREAQLRLAQAQRRLEVSGTWTRSATTAGPAPRPGAAPGSGPVPAAPARETRPANPGHGPRSTTAPVPAASGGVTGGPAGGVRPPGTSAAAPVPVGQVAPGGQPAEERLRRLEDKLDGLLRDLESLRKQIAPRDPAQRRQTGDTRADPEARVKGVITRVEPSDKALVGISIGSDAGLATGQVLEVFRTGPNPQYLGRVRLLDVQGSSSVGRQVAAPGGLAPQSLRQGDTVMLRIQRW